jgi:hypothetical protein
MDFLLFPGGIVGIMVCLFLYLRSQRGVRRSIYGRADTIVRSNLAAADDIEQGYAAVATSMQALRAAKQEEHQLLLKNWHNQYMALLPDTDPEKTTHQAKLQGVSIEEAKFVLDNAGRMMPVVEDGPEWKPLSYTRKDPDEELTYTDRRIQRAGAFVRSEPNTKASTYGVASGGAVWRFDGYVRGEPVAGNDIWFVYIGKASGLRKYVHSIATTNRSISGLPDMTYPISTADYTINPHVPLRKAFTPKIYHYDDGSVKRIETLEEDSNWQKHHKAKSSKGLTRYLNPDQEREKERLPAIVKNYQEGLKK